MALSSRGYTPPFKLSLLAISVLIIYDFFEIQFYNIKIIYEKRRAGGTYKKKELLQRNSEAVYVGGKPGPPVRLITYVSQGMQPMWNVGKGEIVAYLPPPHEDNITSHYKRSDIFFFSSILKDVHDNIPRRLRMRSLSYLEKVQHKFSPDTQRKLMIWLNVTKGSNRDFHTVKYDIAQLKILSTKDDPTSQWTLRCNSCFKSDFTTLIEPESMCNVHSVVDIFAIVTSIPKSRKSREAIRKTWGSWTRNNTSNLRLVFLFGVGWSESDNRILVQESDEYGDILQSDYHDSYYNLTQKVVSGFRWVLRVCPQTKFILRSAEDTFVNLPEVLHLLQRLGNQPRFQDYQIGLCLGNVRVTRFPDFRVYLSTEEYNQHTFPPYAYGTTFIMSRKLTLRILSTIPHIRYMPVEDAYFGLVLREIGSGCLNVDPFPAATDAVNDRRKYEMFNKVYE